MPWKAGVEVKLVRSIPTKVPGGMEVRWRDIW